MFPQVSTDAPDVTRSAPNRRGTRSPRAPSPVVRPVECLEPRQLLSTTTWSTDLDYQYVGAAGANGVATDATGAVYVAGGGSGADGAVHGLVLKKDPTAGAWSATPVLDYQLAPGKSTTFLDVGADTAGNVYAVGRGADVDGLFTWVVARSGDGGATWGVVDRYRYVPGQNAEATAFAADADGAIYVGGYGKDSTYRKNGINYVEHWVVRKSTDGGATWQTVDDYRYAADYYSRAQGLTVSGGTVYAVGKSRDFWVTRRSTDGGSTWSTIDQYQLDTQWNSQANSVAADAAGNVYVVGEGVKGPKMSRTANWVVRKLPAGGSTWSTVDRWQLSANVATGAGSIAEDVVTGPGGEVDVVGHGYADTGGTSGHYLSRSSADGGLTWATIDDVKPDPAANAAGYAITRDASGNLLTAGTVGFSTGGGSHMTVRTTTTTTTAAAAAAAPATLFSTTGIADPAQDDSTVVEELLSS
jgi:hypothetical protein